MLKSKAKAKAHLQQQSMGADDAATCIPTDRGAEATGATQLQREVRDIWHHNMDFATKRRVRALMRVNAQRKLMFPEHEAEVILFTPRMSAMEQKVRNLRRDLNKRSFQLPNPLPKTFKNRLEKLSRKVTRLGDTDCLEQLGHEVFKLSMHASQFQGRRKKGEEVDEIQRWAMKTGPKHDLQVKDHFKLMWPACLRLHSSIWHKLTRAYKKRNDYVPSLADVRTVLDKSADGQTVLWQMTMTNKREMTGEIMEKHKFKGCGSLSISTSR